MENLFYSSNNSKTIDDYFGWMKRKSRETLDQRDLRVGNRLEEITSGINTNVDEQANHYAIFIYAACNLPDMPFRKYIELHNLISVETLMSFKDIALYQINIKKYELSLIEVAGTAEFDLLPEKDFSHFESYQAKREAIRRPSK